MRLRLFEFQLFALLCFSHVAQAQDELKNYISIGIANSLIVSGEQNATYDIVHAAQVDYAHALNQRISLHPQLGYAISPYNKNFKLTAFQALAGIEYKFQKAIHSFSLHVGYEYSRESYAFKLGEFVSRGVLSNSAVLIKATASFTLIKNLRIQPFFEVIPSLRAGVGVRLTYIIFAKTKA